MTRLRRVSNTDGYQSLRLPAYVEVALLTLAVVAVAVAFAVEMNHFAVLTDLDAGVAVARADVDRADELARSAELVRLLVLIAAATAFLLWFARAYRNLERLGVAGLRHAQGWALGAWFVPVVNLFKPKQVADDIWRASEPQLRAERWHDRAVSPWLHWWWAFWIAGGAFLNLAAFATLRSKAVAAQLQSSSYALVADVLFAGSAALAIIVVSLMTVRLEARAQAVSAARALAAA